MEKNILEQVRLSFVSRANYIETELRQSQEEGKIIDETLRRRAQQVVKQRETSQAEDEAILISEELRMQSVRAEFPYQEPEEIEKIIAQFPQQEMPRLNKSELRDKLLGAWLGRTAGCLLGQPVENWHRERILGFLEDTDNRPIRHYLSSAVGADIRSKYDVKDEPGLYGNPKINWINNINCGPEDDDTNYTVMGLSIVEAYGRDFTPMDVAEFFTLNLPVFVTCTAERMAYKNIVNGILPPRSADYGNPYREWLGAQIRVDGYAYVNAGNPRAAAEMAVRDASVTHTKNGIYASAFCAALIAASAVVDNARKAIEYALTYVPKASRLYDGLVKFLEFCDKTDNPDQVIQYIHSHYDEKNQHEWCHVIPNDFIICMALLYGKDDFSRVIGLAVEAGFDTDCNGATVGSAFGMMYGAKAIPDEWTAPLKNQLITRIGREGKVSFDALTDRCLKQINA